MLRHVKVRRRGKVDTTTVEVSRHDPIRDAVRMAVRPLLDDLEDTTPLLDLYDRWQPSITLNAGDVVAYQGRLWKTVQPHTAQTDWPPEKVPALFTVVGQEDDDGHMEWEPGIVLEVDDVVSFDGRLWRTVQAHTTQAGWEPPSTPALFDEVNDG